MASGFSNNFFQMCDNAIVLKSEQLAIRIVNLYRYLFNEKHENIMSRQLMRSGTSIGANVAEAQCAQSTADFVNKMHIAYKECSETRYWIRLLYRTEYLTEEQYASINNDLNEIFALLTAILKSTKTVS